MHPSSGRSVARSTGSSRALELEPCGDDRFRGRRRARPLHAGLRRADRRPGARSRRAHRHRTRSRTPCTPTSSRPASPGEPVELTVDRVRDGRSDVDARASPSCRATRTLLVALASFHANPAAPELADPPPPVPPPDQLPRAAGLARDLPPGARRSRHELGRATAAARPAHRRGAQLPGWRPAEGTRSHWMRLPRDVGDDARLHTALLAYASDYLLLDMAFRSYPEPIAPGAFTASASITRCGSTARSASTRWHLHTQETSPSPAIAAWCAARSTTPTGSSSPTSMQEVLVRPALR